MPRELPVLAVNRHKVLGPRQVEHEEQFLACGVSRHVQRWIHRSVEDFGLSAVDVVDHAEDGFFISGDHAGAEDNLIAFFDPRMAVLADRRSRERRKRLSLTAGDDHGALGSRQALDIAGAQQKAVGDAEQAQIVRQLTGGLHAAPDERHLPAALERQVEDLLDTMRGRGKATDENSPAAVLEQIFKLRTDRFL